MQVACDKGRLSPLYCSYARLQIENASRPVSALWELIVEKLSLGGAPWMTEMLSQGLGSEGPRRSGQVACSMHLGSEAGANVLGQLRLVQHLEKKT